LRPKNENKNFIESTSDRQQRPNPRDDVRRQMFNNRAGIMNISSVLMQKLLMSTKDIIKSSDPQESILGDEYREG
jgi:hypothetical protein